jgi:uncharacterized protein affecting Mg2+/Co2+ transport
MLRWLLQPLRAESIVKQPVLGTAKQMVTLIARAMAIAHKSNLTHQVTPKHPLTQPSCLHKGHQHRTISMVVLRSTSGLLAGQLF